MGLSLIIDTLAVAQGTNCETSTDFCTDSPIIYEAGTNNPPPPPGPNYSCAAGTVFTQPNPAWFDFEILTPGLIQIDINATPPRDIDFAVWGPFPSGTSLADACNLIFTTGIAPADCSYAGGTGTETPEVTGNAVGEVFVMMLTNFSNAPTEVTFSQTGGNGVTNCNRGVVVVPVIPDYTPILTGTAAYSRANLEWSRAIDTLGLLPPIQEFEVYITDDGGITYTLVALTRDYFISLPLINGIEYGFRVRPIYVIQGGNNYLPGNYSNLVFLRPSIILGTEEGKSTGVSVFPNPSEGNFTLRFANIISQKTTIKVMDLTGKVMLTQEVSTTDRSSSYSVSLPQAAAGMYIVQIETEKGIYQHKISITK